MMIRFFLIIFLVSCSTSNIKNKPVAEDEVPINFSLVNLNKLTKIKDDKFLLATDRMLSHKDFEIENKKNKNEIFIVFNGDVLNIKKSKEENDQLMDQFLKMEFDFWLISLADLIALDFFKMDIENYNILVINSVIRDLRSETLFVKKNVSFAADFSGAWVVGAQPVDSIKLENEVYSKNNYFVADDSIVMFLRLNRNANYKKETLFVIVPKEPENFIKSLNRLPPAFLLK